MRALGMFLLMFSSSDPWGWTFHEARKAHVEQAVAAASPNHPWAGSYYQGDGLGANEYLSIAPDGQYTFENWGCMGLYDRDGGRIHVERGTIRFEGAKSFQLAKKTFNIVPWGKRVYLIPDDQLISFANYVNVGWEPRYEAHGSFFVRRRETLELASGVPRVPDGVKPYFLKNVVDGAISSVGPSVEMSSESIHSGELQTEVELDIGRREGMLPDMELHLRDGREGDATIRSAGARTSTAVLYSTAAPHPGWRVSTRYDFKRAFAPYDRPYFVTLTRQPGARFPPYRGSLKSLPGDAPSRGAEANGFKIIPIAEARIAAVDGALLHWERIEPIIDDAFKPLGANAYAQPLATYVADEPGLWPKSTVAVAYRIEYEGRPVDASDFENDYSRGPFATDWSRTRSAIQLKRHRYYLAERDARGEAWRKRLHLTTKQIDNWATLKVEDLNEKQRAALREQLNMRDVRTGLVKDAVPWNRPAEFESGISEDVWQALRPIRDADPGLYPDYRRLADEVYRFDLSTSPVPGSRSD